MKLIKFIFLLGIFVITIYSFLKMILSMIHKRRNHKNSKKEDVEKFLVLMLVFLAPIFLWLLDSKNLFSKFYPNFLNITRDYDWLSFIGTYSGAIVSAILLIYITEKDRNENTNVLREAQRPYLDVNCTKMKSDFFDNESEQIIVFDHGNDHDKELKKDEYLTLCIRNNGASVAIIEINKTVVELQYQNNKNILEKQRVLLNASINRLSIKCGEEIYIKFHKKELYKNGKLLNNSQIISSKVFYKDLFNKEYLDECKLGKSLIVIHDNEKIE